VAEEGEVVRRVAAAEAGVLCVLLVLLLLLLYLLLQLGLWVKGRGQVGEGVREIVAREAAPARLRHYLWCRALTERVVCGCCGGSRWK
jgi:hypothetical protein